MKNKFLRKAILPSIIALGAAVASFTTVTYAWFTSGSSAKVNDITIDVKSASGLQIGINNFNETNNAFGSFSSLATFEMAKAGYTQATAETTGYVMTPCSSAGNVNSSGNLEFFTATLNTNKGSAPISKIDAVSHSDTLGSNPYVLFDLFIENTGAAKKVFLTNTIVKAKDSTKVGTELSARIGFVNEGVYDATQGTTPHKYFKVDKKLWLGHVEADVEHEIVGVDGKQATIYEPNNTTHTTNAVSKYNLLDGITAVTDSAYVSTYALKATKTASAESTDDIERFADNATYYSKDVTLKNTSDTYFNVAANNVTKIRVFIWCEGQDMDCLNDVAGTGFIVQLGFDAAEITDAE